MLPIISKFSPDVFCKSSGRFLRTKKTTRHATTYHYQLPPGKAFKAVIANTSPKQSSHQSVPVHLHLRTFYRTAFPFQHDSIPFLALEIPKYDQGDHDHESPGTGISVFPAQFRHHLKIHSPDSGKKGQRNE